MKEAHNIAGETTHLTTVDIDTRDEEVNESTIYGDDVTVAATLLGSSNGVKRPKTFYEKHIDPRLEKGFLSNLATFTVMVIGRLFKIPFPDSVIVELIFQFGLFGFAGGITNWLAIKMLFDEVPGLYGSGVIPKRFKEIRETVKNVILGTFFDETYLKKYLSSKAKSFLEGANLDSKINALLESPEVDRILDEKLAALVSRPEGMLFVMMGIDPLSLKPMIKPFVTSMGSDIVPFLIKSFDVGSLVNIETIRDEIDKLMTTKLQELTPEIVKELMETVMRTHLGWLIVWGNVFGGVIGIVTVLVNVATGWVSSG